MEALGATAASLEVGKTVVQIWQKIKEIRGAPAEIKQILDETTRLNGLLSFMNRQHAKFSHNVQPIQELIDIKEHCTATANELLSCAKSFEDKIQLSKWKGSLRVVLDKSTLGNLRRSLDSAKASLMLAQQLYNIIQSHQQMLRMIETNNLLQQVAARQTITSFPTISIPVPNSNTLPSSTSEDDPPTHIVRRKNHHPQGLRNDVISHYSMTTPTRWLGWTLQLRAWRQFDGWTFNFRIWNYRANDSPIFVLAREGNVDALRQLLRDKQGSVTDLDSDNCTALHSAIDGCQFETAKLLLEYGADVDRRTKPPALSNYRRGDLTPREYFLKMFITTNPTLSQKTAGSLMTYAKATMDLFTQYQHEDLCDLAAGIRNATTEWDALEWTHDIYPAMNQLVFESMPTLHHDLSLSERISLCSQYFNTDPELVIGWLGHDFFNCPDGLYSLFAGCIGCVFVLSHECTISGSDGKEYAKALQGWRKLLAQLTTMENGPNFGSTSILLSLFYAGTLGPFEQEIDIAQRWTWLTQSWIRELQTAGLTADEIESFADHERRMLPVFELTYPRNNHYYHVTRLESGPEPEAWCVYGHEFYLDAYEPTPSEFSGDIPGAWREDSESNHEPCGGDDGWSTASDSSEDNDSWTTTSNSSDGDDEGRDSPILSPSAARHHLAELKVAQAWRPCSRNPCRTQRPRKTSKKPGRIFHRSRSVKFQPLLTRATHAVPERGPYGEATLASSPLQPGTHKRHGSKAE